jgi:transcription-repair coupling factor (superfamily II helicase)
MMEELGSGFYLAMHDLEIRGAGEVLGESQSGQIQEVGFDLYTRMLERAVRALKDGKAIDLDQPLEAAAEIKLHTPALLPEAYCSDVQERLTLYKRLANCKTREELELMREELVDRFGLLPEAARALLDSHLLRLLAAPLGIARVDATHEALQLQFQKDPPIDRGKIIALVQKRKNIRLAGADRLRMEAKMPEWPQRVQAAKELLDALAA